MLNFKIQSNFIFPWHNKPVQVKFGPEAICGYTVALIGRSGVQWSGVPIAQNLVKFAVFAPWGDSIYRLRLNVTRYKYTSVHCLTLNVALTTEESKYSNLQTKLKFGRICIFWRFILQYEPAFPCAPSPFALRYRLAQVLQSFQLQRTLPPLTRGSAPAQCWGLRRLSLFVNCHFHI